MDLKGIVYKLFVYSKFAEFFDTLWLILRQKEVIFLHYFHHSTVLYFSWHCWCSRSSVAHWFAMINYSVHALMYSYYFLSGHWRDNGKMKARLNKVAPFITTIQILQMFAGLTILTTALKQKPNCQVSYGNLAVGYTMYAAYTILFSLYFLNRYMQRRQRWTEASEELWKRKAQ